jgi:hypothetical protein
MALQLAARFANIGRLPTEPSAAILSIQEFDYIAFFFTFSKPVCTIYSFPAIPISMWNIWKLAFAGSLRLLYRIPGFAYHVCWFCQY